MRDDFEYEIKELTPNILGRIRAFVSEGEELLKGNPDDGLSARRAAWIETFGGVVREVDPLGEPACASISEDWRTGHWFMHYGHPKDAHEETAVFGQLVGVAKSLLSGRVRVVMRKLNKQSVESLSVFHRRPLKISDNQVFVIMPFTESWSDYVWRSEIKNIVECMQNFSLICRRADDLFGHDVMLDIYESIATARLVIADVTGRNSNVFYELGIAHTLGKDVIILSQGTSHIPFDLNRFRHCIYSNDGPGYEKLREYLPSAIANILAD
jgi:hypothetical protein